MEEHINIYDFIFKSGGLHVTVYFVCVGRSTYNVYKFVKKKHE